MAYRSFPICRPRPRRWRRCAWHLLNICCTVLKWFSSSPPAQQSRTCCNREYCLWLAAVPFSYRPVWTRKHWSDTAPEIFLRSQGRCFPAAADIQTDIWSPDGCSYSLPKRSYGLGIIKTKLEKTTRSSIALSILAMNVDRITAISLCQILVSVFSKFKMCLTAQKHILFYRLGKPAGWWAYIIYILAPIISASTSENLFENVNASSPSNTYSFPFVPFLISTLYKSLLGKLDFAPVTRRIRTFNEWHNKAANLFQDLLLCVQLWKTAGIPFFCGTSANLLIELRLRGASFCVAACRLL